MAKRGEAAAVENELNNRKKDLEAIRSAIESISYEEGQMEALQKVYIDLIFLILNFPPVV